MGIGWANAFTRTREKIMGKRYVITDDLTDQEIDGVSTRVRLVLDYLDDKDEIVREEASIPLDVSANSVESLKALVLSNDAVTFITRMRPLLTVNGNSDNEVVRKWAREAHPELGIKERGRIPAEVTALYRREVTARINAEDPTRTRANPATVTK